LRRVVFLLKLCLLVFCALIGGGLLISALNDDDAERRTHSALSGLSGMVATCLILSSPWFLSYDGLPTWLVYLPLGLSPLAIMTIPRRLNENTKSICVVILGVFMLPSLVLTWHNW
jgi:hypothetical protein